MIKIMLARAGLIATLFFSVWLAFAPLPHPAEAGQGVATTQSPAYGLRIIIVATKTEAEEILAEVAMGRHFALLARERSLDEVTRKDYGFLGRIEKEDLGEPLRSAVEGLLADYGLPVNQVSRPVALPDGNFALLQLVDLEPLEEGQRAFGRGDFRAAEKALTAHVAANPDASGSRLMLGKIYESDGRFYEAEKVYREALRHHPDFEEAYAALGRLLMGTGRYEEAREVFVEGLGHGDSPLLREGLERLNILLLQRGNDMP